MAEMPLLPPEWHEKFLKKCLEKRSKENTFYKLQVILKHFYKQLKDYIEEKEPKTIELTLRDLFTNTYNVKVSSKTKVLEIKEILRDVKGESAVFVESFRLVYEGEPLDDEKTVNEIGLTDGTTLFIVSVTPDKERLDVVAERVENERVMRGLQRDQDKWSESHIPMEKESHSELEKLDNDALRKLAVAEGVDEPSVEEAEDSDAVIMLILERRSHNSFSSPPPDPLRNRVRPEPLVMDAEEAVKLRSEVDAYKLAAAASAAR